MLAVRNRLLRQSDIKRTYTTGKKSYNTLLRIVSATTQQQQSRCTVVVSQKVAKQAVKRNRIKRVIRSLMEERIAQFNATYDIVVIAQPQAVLAQRSQLADALDSLIAKLHLR